MARDCASPPNPGSELSNDEQYQAFCHMLTRCGTDFHSIRQHPLLKAHSLATLTEFYRRRLNSLRQTLPSQPSGASKDYVVVKINRLLRDSTGALMVNAMAEPTNSATNTSPAPFKLKLALPTRDPQIPILLKDWEYFLLQQLNQVKAAYKSLLAADIITSSFTKENPNNSSDNTKKVQKERSISDSLKLSRCNIKFNLINL